jgi:peptidyl-tRNA hydrolase
MASPRLYILMRNDVPTMGWGRSCGKAVAQGTHAANQCVAEAVQFYSDRLPLDDKALHLEGMLHEWENQTGYGFGTTIVFGVDEATMRERVQRAQDAGIHAGIVHDPTFPNAMPEADAPGCALAVLIAFAAAVGFIAVGSPLVGLLAACVGTCVWIGSLASGAALSIQRAQIPSLVPLDTCAYVFGETAECRAILGDLPLMR